MITYPLVVAQYDLKGHKSLYEHWSLAALQTKKKSYIFELVGNLDNFAYEASTNADFSGAHSLCGGCLVGNIDPGQIEWVKAKLQEVRVWVIEALRLLKESAHPGVEITLVTERVTRKELKDEKERWDLGKDTLEDRLFDPDN
ncbi:hypothetical protein CPB84DRAFT_1821681 [Gymnopilus junonius]|uniref:Uncharacterized protein n=1 Tax=Gymnopilus junonius TaxID=109634 RepID=A0A9P5TRZ3_GYMJU|nr:hypothetical protein CPB84DRAFT_1821681 [Gymnopilus junonius]